MGLMPKQYLKNCVCVTANHSQYQSLGRALLRIEASLIRKALKIAISETIETYRKIEMNVLGMPNNRLAQRLINYRTWTTNEAMKGPTFALKRNKPTA